MLYVVSYVYACCLERLVDVSHRLLNAPHALDKGDISQCITYGVGDCDGNVESRSILRKLHNGLELLLNI